ncbi:Frt2/Frt1 [Kluyveromyces lactis]|nr:Frt2/Frt1 [Kluyveromyces lactis]
MEVSHREHTNHIGSQVNPLFRGSVFHKNDAADLRVPWDGKRRKSGTSLNSKTQMGDLTEFNPSHRTSHGNIYHDDITCGSSRFSDALLDSSFKCQDEHSSNRSGHMVSSKPGSGNSSLGHLKNQSYSNISISSTQSFKKTHAKLLNFSQLKPELTTASSSESQPSKGNSLVRQFLETASKAKCNREIIPTLFYSSSANSCGDTSGVLDYLSSGFTDKLFPIFNSKETDPKDMKMDIDCKDIPEYFSMDYIKHIHRDLTALEFRLKHFLMKVILPQEMDFTQNINHLSNLSKSVTQLHTDIEKIKHDTKDIYLEKLTAAFNGSDPASFVSKLTTLMDSHVSRLQALEGKTVDFQNELEAKKLQLRKLENLIKLNDMIGDFKRNMKLSEKLKEYYGTFGDVTVLALSISLIMYLFRRWFASE